MNLTADLELLKDLLPLIIPLVILHLILMTIALIDIRKIDETRGPKYIWVLISIFVSTIGPIIYFLLGRRQ